MTFAEYNTDEYFKNADSTADGLIKAAFEEGKTRDEVEKTLSPLWKADKKGNVKKALDTYYKVETAPKTEEKKEDEIKEEVKETPKEDKTTLDYQTKNFMDTNNAIADTQEDNEYERQKKELFKRWDVRNENLDKMREAMKNIDDHAVNSLPTFMFRRYQNGEFGDTSTPEGKKDAKLRMAYFMINGVGTALQNASAAIKGGQMKESDYEKYKRTNMEEGLANRWNKYKQETNAAMELAKQGGMSEEAITDSIATISANNRLQSAFNQMGERQKVFALQVVSELGGKLGNMNDEQFANTLMAMAYSGNSLDYKESAGMLIYRFIKDPQKRDAALAELGLLNGGGTNVIAGIGGNLLGGGEKKETGTTLEDGTKIDPGKTMSKDELTELRKTAEDLGNKLYNGEITEEQFRKDYAKLEDIMKQHGVRNAISGGIMSQDDYLKQIRSNKLIELSNSFDELQANAKNMSKKDYLEQYEDLKANALKWGIDDKTLKTIEQQKDKTLKKLK